MTRSRPRLHSPPADLTLPEPLPSSPAAPSTPPVPPRFVGLDVHRAYVVVAAVDAAQQVILQPRRVALERFAGGIEEHLVATDAVVLEATTNAGEFDDQLAPLVAAVTVAHPFLVQLVVATRVKTDARDTLNLARLLAAGLIPAVWVPPAQVRAVRVLVAHRRRLIPSASHTVGVSCRRRLMPSASHAAADTRTQPPAEHLASAHSGSTECGEPLRG